MNPFIEGIAYLIAMELKDYYKNILYDRVNDEIMISLRLLRCRQPYSNYILGLLEEKYLGESYIYSDIFDYTYGLAISVGIKGLFSVKKTIESEIEAEILDFVSTLPDMREICISVFNTDGLPN